VMMRSKEKVATAVRKKGKIVIKEQEFHSFTEKSRILRLPILRGMIFLIEMMILGMKTLTWSADQQTNNKEQLSKLELIGSLAFAITMTLLMFVIGPYYLTKLLTNSQGMAFNIVDGGLRLGAFLSYLGIIGLMKDIKRVFQYHGAEHKTVNCYEQKMQLTVSNVKQCSVQHPRCGTSLIVFVIAVSILLFSLIKDPRWYVNIGMRILFIPLIAGLSYETLKFSANHKDNKLLKIVITPGLWVQRLTTREPNNKQIEVAIAALQKVL
ncbi:DUF1385 domain-containing protein, partial [Candidatus Woesearchaeota archaeon]|nr:DUF1385 domain-containing protein [Candidatus Woesearchaeota archaeon]